LQLTAALGDPYPLEIEFKPHSCARPIHNAIDCALAIRSRDNPDPAQILEIEIARHPDWAHYHQNKAPKTYHEAQVSLPFSVAVAFKEGQALLQQYTDRKLKDPLVQRLMNLTQIGVDATLPRGVSCRMTVAMSNGRKLTSQVDYPKGSIQNPMSDAEIRTKFDSLATPVIGAARAAQLAELVDDLEKCSDIVGLMRLTAVRKNLATARRARGR
jgi:2-methylcitrate dehydratase PrpD